MRYTQVECRVKKALWIVLYGQFVGVSSEGDLTRMGASCKIEDEWLERYEEEIGCRVGSGSGTCDVCA